MSHPKDWTYTALLLFVHTTTAKLWVLHKIWSVTGLPEHPALAVQCSTVAWQGHHGQDQALRALSAELWWSRITLLCVPEHCHLIVQNHALSLVYSSKSRQEALLWRSRPHPVLARWCFSSGREEKKSTALLTTSPSIKLLVHQSWTHTGGMAHRCRASRSCLASSQWRQYLPLLCVRNRLCCPRAPVKALFLEGEMPTAVLQRTHKQAA